MMSDRSPHFPQLDRLDDRYARPNIRWTVPVDKYLNDEHEPDEDDDGPEES